MKYIKFILCFLFIISTKVSALLEGHETSLVYLSNITLFDYRSIKNLVVFGYAIK